MGALFVWPSCWLVMAERDGYFAIFPSPRPNPARTSPIVAEIPLFLTARAESTQKLVSLLIENLLRNTILLTFAEQGRFPTTQRAII